MCVEQVSFPGVLKGFTVTYRSCYGRGLDSFTTAASCHAWSTLLNKFTGHIVMVYVRKCCVKESPTRYVLAFHFLHNDPPINTPSQSLVIRYVCNTLNGCFANTIGHIAVDVNNPYPISRLYPLPLRVLDLAWMCQGARGDACDSSNPAVSPEFASWLSWALAIPQIPSGFMMSSDTPSTDQIDRHYHSHFVSRIFVISMLSSCLCMLHIS
jgi:hypothetical protein